MSKISLEEVQSILEQNKVEAAKVASIIKACNEVIEELKADKVPTPKSKYEHVIILNDKDGLLTGKEIAGWVVQQKVGADAATILDKLRSAAATQNENTKRKKNVISDLTALFERLKSKFTKEKELKIKTKELTRVIISDGKY